MSRIPSEAQSAVGRGRREPVCWSRGAGEGGESTLSGGRRAERTPTRIRARGGSSRDQRQVGAAASRPVGLRPSTSELQRMEDSRETSPSSNNSSEELSSALQLSKGMSIFLDVSIDEAVRWAPWASSVGERKGQAQPLAAGVRSSDLHPNYLLSFVPQGNLVKWQRKDCRPTCKKSCPRLAVLITSIQETKKFDVPAAWASARDGVRTGISIGRYRTWFLAHPPLLIGTPFVLGSADGSIRNWVGLTPPLPAASKNKHICFSFYNGSQGLFYVVIVFLLVPPPFPIILLPWG